MRVQIENQAKNIRAHLPDGAAARTAHKTWQAGLEIAERLGMTFEQGLLHHQIGRHLGSDDPTRSTHLDAARVIFLEVGAKLYLNQVLGKLKD